ncbi:unnamed protein product [Brassica oleracea var. botrytis]|uniref:Phytocyanin domain-containing protein n=1 Tax=Brassica oleracea TaxID=3712 RepID=A0A3P6DF62_BRAOL|nr:unnamed protein product [Brassica oleracea]
MFLWLVTFLMISASVSSLEYKLHWEVPPANASTSFNDWASSKRFQVGDIIRFKYKKDSVMQVTKECYKQCNSSHPRFYSNTGKTRFIDDSVPYYFISGTSGHCEKGQKMIVEVISNDRTTTSSAPPATMIVWFCFFSFTLYLVA